MGRRLFVEASHAPHKSERVPRLELRPTLALDKAPLLALLPRSPGAKGSRTAVQAVAGRRPTDPALASKSFERFPQLADPANAPRCPCPRIVARRRQEWVVASRALRLLTDTRKVDEVSTGSESDYANSWIAWFLSTKGNEYFCEVDEEYILDRFNLTGLNSEVHHYAQALDLITDQMEDELNDDLRDSVEGSARHLYGLIHARFIITSRGLSKMVDKYKKADFGRCPRVLCYSQPLLPVGLSDIPYQKVVKLYCPRCEDIYSPKSSRHATIDGAYFGSTFPHMLFMVHPQMVPVKAMAPGMLGNASSGATGTSAGTANAAIKAERYRPRIFGFLLHESAQLHRWQEAVRDQQIARLEALAQDHLES